MSLPAPGTRVSMSHLCPADRLLLWAMRSWVIALKQRVDVAPALQAAFARFNIAECAEMFDALMSVVACGAVRTLAVECVCAGTISEDESRLLAAAALHQAGRGFEARFLLREMLNPASTCHAGDLLDRLGKALSVQRHVLSDWSMQPGRFVFASEPAPLRQPAPTLH